MVLMYTKLKAGKIKNYTNNEDDFLGELSTTVEVFLLVSLRRLKRPSKDTHVPTNDYKVILFISF